MGSFFFIYDFAEFYFALTMSASRDQPEFHMGDANRAWKRVPLIEQSCLQAHGVSVGLSTMVTFQETSGQGRRTRVHLPMAKPGNSLKATGIASLGLPI